MEREKLTIGETGKFLGVSVDTLRRWDLSGKLKALRTAGGHRYYPREQLEEFARDLFATANNWVLSKEPTELSPDYHCETRDVFRARQDKMAILLDKDTATKEIAPLLVAIVGEIGNKSFDHNYGNWPDAPGIFFGYNLNKRIVVLADRGVGIRKTLSRVRPDIKNDIMALRIAFTERVSGRAPEQRGNGLKFVRNATMRNSIDVYLQSGVAFAKVSHDGSLEINSSKENIYGVMAKITY